ncbi:MAG: tetratricopeptide repeat protein, partial [Proteobacteria bacterium]|nr:tetratricopeptide repeat protein [Pseudomonadota bacterium]
MEAGDTYAAISAIVDQVLEARPDDVVARAIKLYTDTQMGIREGDPAAGLDAFDQLQELIDEDPTALQPRIFLTRMVRNEEQVAQTLVGMLEALQLDPLNPRIHFELGNIYSGLEQWDEARSALKKSLELEPAQPNAYVNLARLSLQKGDALDYLQLSLGAMAVDPVDHELPGMIASYLYRLELVEEGDDFRNRVMAIAPTSEVAYRIELLRAMATGDEEASIASARRAIEDDIEDRRAGFSGATLHLLRVAAARGTVAEESAYLEEQAPGILDLEATSVPFKYRWAQIGAFDAWYTTLSKDELYRRIDYVWELAPTFGVDPSENPQIEFATLALRGEVEQAIEVALEHIFSEPVALYLGWEETMRQAQYAEIAEDTRIQAAMKKWQDDEDALREQIRTYLADLYASS